MAVGTRIKAETEQDPTFAERRLDLQEFKPKIAMKKNPASQSGIFNPRPLLAFTLCFVGIFLAMFSFASLATTAPQLPFGKTDMAGAGWASFMIHTDGSIVRVKLWATSPQSPNVLGSFFYDEQEEFLGGFDFSVHRAETGAMADINVIPGNPIHEAITIQAEPEGGFGYTATYNPNGIPSTFKLLVFGAGDQVSWSYDGGDNPADVRLLGIETGTSAFLYMSDEFLAATNGGVNVLGTGGRVTLMADLAMDVTDTLIANWLPISSPTTVPNTGVSTNRLTITTPKGEQECLYAGLLGCSWPRFHGDTAQGPGRYVFHMTGDGVGVAQNSDDVMLYGADARLPIDQTLFQAVSRKTHGAAGSFDVNLPITGSPGIECRSGGATNDYTLVFTFTNPLTSVGGASVAAGTGSVSSNHIDSTDAHKYIVNITGVTNAQVITVSLANVTDSGGNFGSVVSASMAVLIGDVNATGLLTSGDTNLSKAQALQPVTESNFRNDINASGEITTGDVNLIKQNALSQLP